MKGYNVYRGVKKPLEFKGLKGRYIQWAASIIAGSILMLLILKFLLGWLVSFIISFIIGGLLWMNMMMKAKKGVHTKKIVKGLVVMNLKKRKIL